MIIIIMQQSLCVCVQHSYRIELNLSTNHLPSDVSFSNCMLRRECKQDMHRSSQSS